jgi:DNA-binding GntR family transcriptional regulator
LLDSNEVPSPLQRRSTTDRSHAAIFKVLVDGNVEQARRHMQEHLDLAYDSLLGELGQVRVPAAMAAVAAQPG